MQEREKLEALSGLSAEEAKERLVDSLKEEAKTQAASYINDIMDDAKLTANKEAKRIVINPFRELLQKQLSKTLSPYSISNPMKSKVASSVVKDVTSVLWKQQQVLKS